MNVYLVFQFEKYGASLLRVFATRKQADRWVARKREKFGIEFTVNEYLLDGDEEADQ